MFKIADGREQFYQWDIDRQIIVDDPSITEVHFCNRTDECSLVTEVISGVANVPNILLQSSFDLRVFGYDGKATLHEKTFKVKPRTRPSDYVYTETEVKNYDELSKRIDELVNADGIYKLVLPAEGEAVTDERTVEILDKYTCTDIMGSENLPACSYNSTLIIDWRGSVSGHVVLTALKTAVLGKYYVEYDLTFHFDDSTRAFIFDGVTETRFKHATKTSELENDSDFTTKAYVDDAIANIDISGVDLSEYITEAELEAKGYATEDQLNNTEDLLAEYVDNNCYDKGYIDAYIATKTFVTQKIAEAELGGSDVDLTGYATEQYVTNAINTAFAGIATAEGGSY